MPSVEYRRGCGVSLTRRQLLWGLMLSVVARCRLDCAICFGTRHYCVNTDWAPVIPEYVPTDTSRRLARLDDRNPIHLRDKYVLLLLIRDGPFGAFLRNSLD